MVLGEITHCSLMFWYPWLLSFPWANYISDALLMFSIWQLRTWVGKMKGLSIHRSSAHKITQVAPSQSRIPFALSYFSHLHFIAMLRRGEKGKRKDIKSLCKHFSQAESNTRCVHMRHSPPFTGKKSYWNIRVLLPNGNQGWDHLSSSVLLLDDRQLI